MTLSRMPLGRNLESALSAGVATHISGAVDDIAAAVWSGQLAPGPIREAVATLQRHSQFEHMVKIGDAALATGSAEPETRRRYCQALIEVGALHAAELELGELLAETGLEARERGEALGLMGRLNKQRFIGGGRQQDLESAIDAYRQGYALGTDPAWHGVNLLALARRASVDGGMDVAALPDIEQLANDVLTHARSRPENQRTVWEMNTEIEALLALGKGESEAVDVARGLLASKMSDAFELGSLRRQLSEVWRLDPAHPLMLVVGDELLQAGAGAVLDLPDSPMQLEKIFGTALPISYKALDRGLHCAKSVCKIVDANDEGWGTGFLVAGSIINADLGSETILVTNAHVVSKTPGVGQLLPPEVRAHFEVTKGEGEESLVLSDMKQIWTSPPDRSDVTLLRFAGEAPKLEHPIEAAPALPLVTEGAYVYVIGHPAGAGLKFSIRGNDLLAYDQAKRKVHYTAPTEPGSSGSPVFSSQWKLIAVHHAGSSKMRRLDDDSATYQANEGISLEAIRADYAANPPE